MYWVTWTSPLTFRIVFGFGSEGSSQDAISRPDAEEMSLIAGRLWKQEQDTALATMGLMPPACDMLLYP